MILTQEEAFRQAICEQPEDITPRLIYADWLEEQGREQEAALVRCSLWPADRAVSADLRRRRLRWLTDPLRDIFPGPAQFMVCSPPVPHNQQSLTTMFAETHLPARSDWCRLVVRHGFITEIALPARWFRTLAFPLFQRQPIVDVRLSGLSPRTVRDEDEYPSRIMGCEWLVTSRPVPQQNEIPEWLGQFLYTPRRANRRVCRKYFYGTRQLAWEALSRACVAYGRTPPGER